MSAAPDHEHGYDESSECEYCRLRIPFQMPSAAVDACLRHDLVIFAGAGVSTESRQVLPWTLYDELARTVDASDDASFPSVMTAYEDAQGRPELLQQIKKRFDYIDAFGALRYDATRFHKQLGTLFYVDTIITTNWDTYFERECGAIPIVTPADYAFWSLSGRKVFKIHGSINNVGSIVATEQDYETCYESLREGVIGSTLKHMLATKTIVFVGYSFGDDDFARIYGLIRDQLGSMLRRPIIVTLDRDFDESRFLGATVITTDGAYFIEELKDAVIERRLRHVLPHMRRDKNASSLRGHAADCASPATILGRRLHRRLHQRDDLPLADEPDRWHIPYGHIPGAPEDETIDSRAKLKKVLARGEQLHKTAYRQAKRIVDGHGDGMVVHHPATLLGLSTSRPSTPER